MSSITPISLHSILSGPVVVVAIVLLIRNIFIFIVVQWIMSPNEVVDHTQSGWDLQLNFKRKFRWKQKNSEAAFENSQNTFYCITSKCMT